MIGICAFNKLLCGRITWSPSEWIFCFLRVTAWAAHISSDSRSSRCRSNRDKKWKFCVNIIIHIFACALNEMKRDGPRWRCILEARLAVKMLLLWDNKRLLSWDPDRQPHSENRGRITIKDSKIGLVIAADRVAARQLFGGWKWF